ncbi:MAG: hypothetical protein HZB26_22440 [Candidatus Hydrogenedentes bacterium]|nr:hypothetical protein [Candidatus Hydrogenedentota bacterium]
MSDDTGAGGGDPTQRLLTALGRFQRHVARAEAGAPQETWSDECMNQLIAAFEIAKNENWNDVVEALTETARVLQTYEDSGCAHDCVPFLADSYEILCLMVGDLIVGSVRSGVMEKWRRRYERAVSDIGAAGLKLVEDHGNGSSAAPELNRNGGAREIESPSPFELPPLEPLPGASDAGVADDELPSLDDLPPLSPAPRAEADPISARGLEPEDASSADTGESDEQPMTTMLFDTALEEDADEMDDAGSPSTEEPAPANLSDKNGTSPQVVEVLDKLCECLSRLENYPGGDRHETGVAMEYSLTFLERHARDYGRTGAVELCREMEKMSRVGLAKTGPLEDRFFELSYAFCGAYVDANSGSQDPIVTNWIEECEILVEQWQAARTDEQPAAAPLDKSAMEDGSPEHLLETAQRAVERGNSTDAKVLALQAAVNIARAEAEETETRVRTAESRLNEGARAIETAQGAVRTAEQSVSETESSVSAAESEVAGRRSTVAAIQRRLAESDDRISQLEEQLRAIQAQLESEVQCKGETLSELAGARTSEADAQSHLEQVLSDEDTARVNLEHARQHVKHLQQKRAEIEAALERMRDVLTRRRSSLADIEQTMNLIRGATETDLPSDQDLLF